MAGSNDADKQSPAVYCPLPELEDPQGMAVASEVDVLLVAVIARMPMPMDQWRYFRENLRQAYDLASRFECEKHFLAILLKLGRDPRLPEEFFPLLMRVAIYEPNPSLNRYYIEPCLRSFGYCRVLEALLTYLVTGTNREKAGTVRALYWAQLPLLVDDLWWQKKEREREQTGNSGEALQRANGEFQEERARAKAAFQKVFDEELADLRATIAGTMLKEFIENEDLDLRRSLIPQLSFDPARYPEAWKPLLPTALAIARNHPDDYIRRRVEIQAKRGNEQTR
jgi:hypothetical protein